MDDAFVKFLRFVLSAIQGIVLLVGFLWQMVSLPGAVACSVASNPCLPLFIKYTYFADALILFGALISMFKRRQLNVR